MTFNGIMDIPVGKGKSFLGNIGNSNKWVNALVGGDHVAFVGTMVSQAFQVSSINGGLGSRPGNLWFNGYIAPNLINTPNSVQGIPESYRPYLTR